MSFLSYILYSIVSTLDKMDSRQTDICILRAPAEAKKPGLWFADSVCLDVDILLHIFCYCVIDIMFKALQEYVSRDKFVSNWTGSNSF